MYDFEPQLSIFRLSPSVYLLQLLTKRFLGKALKDFELHLKEKYKKGQRQNWIPAPSLGNRALHLLEAPSKANKEEAAPDHPRRWAK